MVSGRVCVVANVLPVVERPNLKLAAPFPGFGSRIIPEWQTKPGSEHASIRFSLLLIVDVMTQLLGPLLSWQPLGDRL